MLKMRFFEKKTGKSENHFVSRKSVKFFITYERFLPLRIRIKRLSTEFMASTSSRATWYSLFVPNQIINYWGCQKYFFQLRPAMIKKITLFFENISFLLFVNYTVPTLTLSSIPLEFGLSKNTHFLTMAHFRKWIIHIFDICTPLSITWHVSAFIDVDIFQLWSLELQFVFLGDVDKRGLLHFDHMLMVGWELEKSGLNFTCQTWKTGKYFFKTSLLTHTF